jgi:protoporphyrinogen/coproporphyrinogen III oxidase
MAVTTVRESVLAGRTAVAVVGGGISGLAAALRLAERLDPRTVVLLESSPLLGGKIRTERHEGLVLEAGPDCFLASKPAGVELCRQLGIAHRLMGTIPSFRRSYVKRNGRLYPLPEGITGLVPSRLKPLLTTGILSLKGRIRAGLEWMVPAHKNGREESVAEFARRRFGAEAYDWLIEPLLSGIFAGDGEALSLDAAFPQLRATEQQNGSLLKPLLTRARAAAPVGFVTLPDGLSELVEALSDRLREIRVATDSVVRHIVPAALDGGYRLILADGRTLDTDTVILSTPAAATARLVEPLDLGFADALRSIATVSTATVSLAFPRAQVARPLDGYGYVSPRKEGGPVVACSWTSNKFAGRAPVDTVLVRCFIGRAGHDEMVHRDDTALVELARQELAQVHGIVAPPTFSRVWRWGGGMPQYTLGHCQRLAKIDARRQTWPGLHLAGASYRGVGIPDCIASGWAAADAASAQVPAV